MSIKWYKIISSGGGPEINNNNNGSTKQLSKNQNRDPDTLRFPNYKSKVAAMVLRMNTITTHLAPTTAAFIPLTLEQTRARSISNGVSRIYKKKNLRIDLETLIGLVESKREKMYVKKYFVLSPEDKRFIVDWPTFAKDVLGEATGEDEKWANILLRVFNEECIDMSIYAEWHHLLPVCMWGSVLDLRNYVRIQPGLHLLVHAALCYFFPSYIKLQFALNFMLNQIEHKTKLLKGQDLTDFLQDAVNNEDVFATARIEVAEAMKKARSKLIMVEQQGKDSKQTSSTDHYNLGNRKLHYTARRERLWSEQLNRALKYADEHEIVPMSLPPHLRRPCEFLSEKEISDKNIISWIIDTCKIYFDPKQVNRGMTMTQCRKDQLRTSGLLDKVTSDKRRRRRRERKVVECSNDYDYVKPNCCVVCYIVAKTQHPDKNSRERRKLNIIKQSKRGCKTCGVHGKGAAVCPYHWENFDHSH